MKLIVSVVVFFIASQCVGQSTALDSVATNPQDTLELINIPTVADSIRMSIEQERLYPSKYIEPPIASFEGTLKEAIAYAEKEGKTVVLDFYANWCLPCKQMERISFTNEAVVERFKRDYILMRVDIEQFTGMDIAEDYDVIVLPTLTFLDTKGKVRKKMVGYQSAEQILTVE